MTIVPRSRHTSAPEYGRTIPCQRGDVAHSWASAACTGSCALPFPLPLPFPFPFRPGCVDIVRSPLGCWSKKLVRQGREKLGAFIRPRHFREKPAGVFEAAACETVAAHGGADPFQLLGRQRI